MIPGAFVLLEALPLTPNGKLDRDALPQVDVAALTTGHVAPRNGCEETLVRIWKDVLQVERVGIHDNFFHIGGHSLLATQVVSRVRNILGVEVPLRRIFANPTVAALCLDIRQRQQSLVEVRPKVQMRAEEEAELPLSFAQQRMWFVDQLEPGTGAYNIPGAVRLKGTLDTDALSHALTEIVRRHEVLRTRFETRGGHPVQIIAEARGLAGISSGLPFRT
jgi:hypothetical protein